MRKINSRANSWAEQLFETELWNSEENTFDTEVHSFDIFYAKRQKSFQEYSVY